MNCQAAAREQLSLTNVNGQVVPANAAPEQSFDHLLVSRPWPTRLTPRLALFVCGLGPHTADSASVLEPPTGRPMGRQATAPGRPSFIIALFV